MYKLGRCLWCWSQIWSNWALCESVSAFSHLLNPGAHTLQVPGPILIIYCQSLQLHLEIVLARLPTCQTNLPCVSATSILNYAGGKVCAGNKAIFCDTYSIASLLNLYMYVHVYVYKVAAECTCACLVVQLSFHTCSYRTACYEMLVAY